MSKTKELHSVAKQIIPGASQLFSKKPELYSHDWPAYYDSAKGIEVTDLDGNTYKDFSNFAVGACVLGYADPDVDAAVIRSIKKGVASSVNCTEEVDLAQILLILHPWAEMCRFTRSGGEAIAVAVRIARARTNRDRIVVCGYHGWTDAYLGAGGHLKGLRPVGVPIDVQNITKSFNYNDIYKLEQLLINGHVAAVVMEVERDTPPAQGFLQDVRTLTTKNNTLLIFDEITSGFRCNPGGLHLNYGVQPDIAVFGKAIGNGYAISAVIGTKAAMAAANDTFISSTNWTERTGFAAAIATIYKFWSTNAEEHLHTIGSRVRASIPLESVGLIPLTHFKFSSPEISTLYTQEMLKRGYLAGKQFYPSLAHTNKDTTNFINTSNLVLDLIKTNQVKLEGLVQQEGFQRLTG